MKIDYICDCEQTNFNNNYSYWEDKESTEDENEIIDFLKNNFLLKDKKILHIGIGNSNFAKIFSNINEITGITISKNEINYANNLNLKKYNVLLLDKYSINFKNYFKNHRFDLIVDPNLKSYSCCEKSFDFMFKNFSTFLSNNGIIITSRKGMNWYKKLKPKISFSLKKFFFFKLKEIEGNSKNTLTLEELEDLSYKYKLKIKYNEKICEIKK